MAPNERVFWTTLTLVTMAIVAFAMLIMLDMEPSSRHQGGRFYVAIGAMATFILISGAISKLVHRFAPFDIGTSEPERRFALFTLFLGLIAAAVLFGAAFLLPQ
jgi:hypothetical protein